MNLKSKVMELDELKDCSYKPSKMTREEEIQKYANELGQKYFPNHLNIWARENVEAQFVADACMRMARYIKQELIKKACEWWEQREGDYDLYDAWSGDYVSFKSVIMDFRKAMEEQS